MFDEQDGVLYYKNSQGKTIGKITASERIYNPNTQKRDTYITIEIHELGKMGINASDDVSDERLRAFAEYRKECIKLDMEILQEKMDKINRYLEKGDCVKC